MIIIGVDFHPEFQQIASVDTSTGEFQEKRLAHREDAEKFYRGLAVAGQKVRVGMEASGHARWFERLLAELQIELWVRDAAEIRSKRVRKQKTDRQDAQMILRLLLEDRFPQIWVPRWENRDLRQLLWHRHRMVQVRTPIMNQLQAVALNEGVRCKKRLWREHGRQQLESFRLASWASRPIYRADTGRSRADLHYRALDIAQVQKVSNMHRLVDDQRNARNHVFKCLLGCEGNGNAPDSESG